MTATEEVFSIAPGTDQWNTLLSGIASGAKDRDLNDENPFDQVTQLKRAGFGTLRLPRELGGAGLTVATVPEPDKRKVSGPPLVLCKYQKLSV